MQNLFQKPTSQVLEADVLALVGNQIGENEWLDFKAVLPGPLPVHKEEFCKDVCAFANSGGGLLIFGVGETDGNATSMDGVECANEDGEKRRLQQVLDSGVEPKIHGVKFDFLLLSNSRRILSVTVPRSVNLPHRTKGRFPFRRGTSCREMDIGELRSAFKGMEEMTKKIETYRAERVRQISNGFSLPPLSTCVVGVLHFLPLISFQAGTRYEVVDYCVEDRARLTTFAVRQPLDSLVTSFSLLTLDGPR